MYRKKYIIFNKYIKHQLIMWPVNLTKVSKTFWLGGWGEDRKLKNAD